MSSRKAQQGFLLNPYIFNEHSIKFLLNAGPPITDASLQHLVITNNGVTTTTEQSLFGAASVKFDNSSNYLSVSGSAFNFGSSDFRISCYVFFNEIATNNYHKLIVSHDDISSTRGWLLLANADNSGKITFSIMSGSTSYSVVGPIAQVGEWYEVVVARVGSVLSMTVNNSTYTSTSVAGITFNSINQPLYVGALKNGLELYKPATMYGYIQDLKIQVY